MSDYINGHNDGIKHAVLFLQNEAATHRAISERPDVEHDIAVAATMEAIRLEDYAEKIQALKWTKQK